SHCQGAFGLRADTALALGIPPENIVVEHVEGAGCYGHNGADDVAFDAVLLARAAEVAGRPVRVQWSREDELAWAAMGAAMASEAELAAAGDMVDWRTQVGSTARVSARGRMPTPTVLSPSLLANPSERLTAFNPPMTMGGGAERNSVPLYDFAAMRVTCHRLL